MKHLTARIKPGMSLFACAACALGLLLWARLLLVSHPPRVATAEPAPAAPLPSAPQESKTGEKEKAGDRSDAGRPGAGTEERGE